MSESNTNTKSEPLACCCGCETPTARAFAPGHDNRFYGQVIRGERDEAELARFPGLQRKWDARKAAEAEKAVRKAAGLTAEPRVAHATTEAIEAAIAAGEVHEPAERPLTATAREVKEGRWWYPVKQVTDLGDGLFEVDWKAKNGNMRTSRVTADKLR